MATETTTQIIKEDPAIEAYRTGLLASVREFIDENLGSAPPPPVLPPGYQVAGLTDAQKQASNLQQQGVGVYLPYLQKGTQARESGLKYLEDYGFGGLSEAMGATREGQQMLSQASGRQGQYINAPFTRQTGAEQRLNQTFGQFDPTATSSFMNPYEDQVVQQAMRDIRREGDIREQGLQAQAAASGAFGGSRQAVAEQELARNVMEQQAQTASQLRMGGYQQAAQQAQKAYEDQMGRGQQGAQLLGNLGLQYGQLEQANVGQMMDMAGASGQMGQQLGSLAGMGGTLGQQMGQMGVQEAGIGQLVQQLLGQDVKGLEAFGARDQALQQAILDAQRMSNMQLYQSPYQQYSFLSDIYKGVPGSQQQVSVSSTQDPSPFQQVAGLGIAGLSALGGAKSTFGF